MIKQTLALPDANLLASLKEVHTTRNLMNQMYTFKLGSDECEAKFHVTENDLMALSNWIREVVK